MPLAHRVSDHIAARIGTPHPAPAGPWIAPAIAELLARIEAALRTGARG
jgi:hypothetical protein